MIEKREMFPNLFTFLNYKRGAEVGVQAGDFAQIIVDGWPGKLYLIDCWEFQPTGYVDISNVSDDQQDKLYQSVVERFKKYGSRVEVIKAFSGMASSMIVEELDFVYLDANHSKEAVKSDIQIWWPKIRAGGILSGHDYLDGELQTGTYGVKAAVDEFAAQNNLTVNKTNEHWASWIIFKP